MTQADSITLTVVTQAQEIDVTLPAGATVMDAINAAGKQVPHFCYHKRLSVAGNCRMCLVEIEGAPKPVASCHWPANNGMRVLLESEGTIAARKGTMELLLANHPLDCPICDQGGECELQDQALAFGGDRSHFEEPKRVVEDKDLGAKIKTVMTRCIHCMRCVRFATEIAGVEDFGATGRGAATQVGTYVEKALQSELSGNMIDLCPVGALNNKPYTFSARPWELTHTKAIDVMDGLGTHIRVDSRAGKVMRIVPRECDDINEEWMTDAARFSWDALTTNRLTTPIVRKYNKLQSCGWPDVFKRLKRDLKKSGPQQIAGLAGDLHSAEDYYAFNNFMKYTLGTDNVDARTDGAKVDALHPSAYVMHTPISEIERADAVLMVGTHLRYECPLLNMRVRRLAQQGVPVALVGEKAELTYPYTWLGETPDVLKDIQNNKDAWATFLEKAERPLFVIGSAVLTREDALEALHILGELAEQYGAVTDGWRGFNVVQRSAGRVAALDMAVHPTSNGLNTQGICDALKEDQMEVLIQYGDVDVPLETLRRAKTLVYIGTHLTDQADQADVILPAAAYTEKAGLWTNIERRVQETVKAVAPPLQAKEDWKIFRALSAELGKPLPFDTLAQVREGVMTMCESYNLLNAVVPPAWSLPEKSGELSTKPFKPAVTAVTYYQSNELLRASETMHKCQQELLLTPPAQKERNVA